MVRLHAAKEAWCAKEGAGTDADAGTDVAGAGAAFDWSLTLPYTSTYTSEGDRTFGELVGWAHKGSVSVEYASGAAPSKPESPCPIADRRYLEACTKDAGKGWYASYSTPPPNGAALIFL